MPRFSSGATASDTSQEKRQIMEDCSGWWVYQNRSQWLGGIQTGKQAKMLLSSYFCRVSMGMGSKLFLTSQKCFPVITSYPVNRSHIAEFSLTPSHARSAFTRRSISSSSAENPFKQKASRLSSGLLELLMVWRITSIHKHNYFEAWEWWCSVTSFSSLVHTR